MAGPSSLPSSPPSLAAVRAVLGDDAAWTSATEVDPRCVVAAGMLAARADAIDPATLAPDDRHAIEGLRAYRDRLAGDGATLPLTVDAVVDGGAPRCWFGVSAHGGVPWMFCLTAAYLRDVIAILARHEPQADQAGSE